MKKTILPFIIISSVFLISCKSSSFFETPNSLRNISGTLYLANGDTLHGKLIVNTDNFFNKAIKIYADNDKKPMQFNLADVTGYEIRNNYYALKEVRGGIRLGKDYSFMKRLTRPDSRIHLYENAEKVSTSNGNGTSYTHIETAYYLQFPSEQGDAVWPLSSTKFVPNFDEKMSKLVSDCSTLAQKIANKEEGYFYRQVTVFKEKRADVLLNIIDEYNKCR